MLYVQENPKNKPNFAINELTGRKFPNLYKLIGQFGKNRITSLNLPESASKTLIEHRDLVLIGTNRKKYMLSLYKSAERQSLMIADFRTDGVNRTMFFDDANFQDSIKIERTGASNKAQRSRLSEVEQIAFLNELNEPMIDIKSTRELSKIASTPK